MLARVARWMGVVGTGILSLPQIVHAHCPLCALAVGAGAMTASYYGMGLSAVGAFVGGLGIVLGMWTNNFVKQKHIPFQGTLIVGVTLGLTVMGLNSIPSQTLYLPFFVAGAPGTLLNKVYWVDKALIGAGLGAIAALAAHALHARIKKAMGKTFFPFQSIVLTLAFITLTAIALQFTLG